VQLNNLRSLFGSLGNRIDISSPGTINSFKTALACLIGYLLVLWTALPESQWIVVTILVVMSAQASIGSLFIKVKMRFWGTVCGTMAAAVIVVICKNNAIELGVAFFIATLFFSYIASFSGDVGYVGTLGAVTVAIVVLSPHPSLAIAGERFYEISLGIIISYLVSHFILPVRSHTIFISSMSSTLKYFRHCFNGGLAGHSLDMDEKILGIFSQQRRLIQETGLELSNTRLDKDIFQQILNTERKLYRAINVMNYSFNAAPESRKIILSLNGFEQFKQEVSQYISLLISAIKSKAVLEIRDLNQNHIDKLELEVRHMLVDIDYAYVTSAHTFVFGARLVTNELQALTDSLKKINYL